MTPTALENERRLAFKVYIWKRDNEQCRVCSEVLKIESEDPLSIAQMYNIPGSGPYDSKSMLTLCPKCHSAVMTGLLEIECEHPEMLCRGPIRAVRPGQK